jgi:signal recognition particle GTPase
MIKDIEQEKFNELTKNVTFHKFDKEIMKKRKKLKEQQANGETYTNISLDLDDETYEKLKDFLIKEDVSVSDYINDILYDLIIQLQNETNGLEVIDSVYLSHNIEKLIETNKDYCVINYGTQDKVVLMTDKEKVELFQEIAQNK